jgi:putative transposase
MRKHDYPSDATDEPWAPIAPLIPVYPGGRPRTTGTRDVLDAAFHPPRTGCRWRYLPADFPPRSAARRHLDEWRHNGTLEAIHHTPRREVRTREEPSRPRTTAGVDRQSGDTTSGGQARGRDDAKGVGGRERHIVVGAMGMVLAVPVTAASVADGAAAAGLFGRLDGQPIGRARRMFGDSKDHDDELYGWVGEDADYEMTVVDRPQGKEGWAKLPIRWAAERGFAWPGRCRRLTRDREKSVRSSGSMIRLAMIRLMLDGLQPSGSDGESCDRKAA